MKAQLLPLFICFHKTPKVWFEPRRFEGKSAPSPQTWRPEIPQNGRPEKCFVQRHLGWKLYLMKGMFQLKSECLFEISISSRKSGANSNAEPSRSSEMIFIGREPYAPWASVFQHRERNLLTRKLAMSTNDMKLLAKAKRVSWNFSIRVNIPMFCWCLENLNLVGVSWILHDQ